MEEDSRPRVTRRSALRSGAAMLAGLAAPAVIEDRQVTVQPKTIDDLFPNPGMGWQTFHRFTNDDPALQGLPSSSAYIRFYWREIEPREGEIDFPRLDDAFARARKAGQRLAFRLMCVGTDRTPMDCPPWLKEKGCRGLEFFYGDQQVRWAPDWEDPKFQEAHFRTIKELGKRYDHSPDIDLVDIGTVGLWGEWHMSGCKEVGSGKPTPMPLEATRIKIIDAWREAFPKTPKVMLIGDEPGLRHAAHHGCGWRADCLGDMGGFSKNWNHMQHFYMQQLKKTEAEEAWKTAPVAFESCWDMRKWVQEGWDVRFIFDYALKCHASYVNNKSAPIPDSARPEVERFLRMMGYRLALKKAVHPAEVRRGSSLKIATTWENLGVAPPYRDYRIAIRLKVSENESKFVPPSVGSIRGWLPGMHEASCEIPIPRLLAAGSYALSLGVVDQSGSPAIRLATAGRDPEGWYPVSTVFIS